MLKNQISQAKLIFSIPSSYLPPNNNNAQNPFLSNEESNENNSENMFHQNEMNSESDSEQEGLTENNDFYTKSNDFFAEKNRFFNGK